NATDEYGETALRRAAAEGHLEIADTLIARGAGVDAADRQGMTPLMWASWHGQTPVVELLLKHGADVHKKSRDGETALLKAAFQGHTAAVRVLIDAGAVVDESDKDGETALILAAAQGNQAIVRMLLERGASPRAATRRGWSPLMAAARNGHPAAVNLLLPVSQVAAVDGKGYTALTHALIGGNQAVVESLLAAGAEETGVLWLWRGFRLARTGEYAEALPWLEKAAASSSAPPGPWYFSIDGWQYEVPTPACFTALAIGTCRQRVQKSAEAREAFRSALANVPEPRSLFTLFRRSREEPGQSLSEQFDMFPDEIEKHARFPEGVWNVRVAFEKDERHGGSRMHETGRTDREVRDFFN
ncbi:MAG: ankyrin repeat domain-containing protein, partial [Deltaproteobacteria bacterium]